uniref:G protein-coupled receptor n=1 Tax=Pristionchus pacificus TaxID=54126 RepID=A0A8R1YDX2_PRIPA
MLILFYVHYVVGAISLFMELLLFVIIEDTEGSQVGQPFYPYNCKMIRNYASLILQECMFELASVITNVVTMERYNVLNARKSWRVQLWFIPMTIVTAGLQFNVLVNQIPHDVLNILVVITFPDIIQSGFPVSGHDDFSIPVSIVNLYYVLSSDTLVCIWTGVFFFRRKVLAILNAQNSSISEKSRILQKALVKSITVHAWLSMLILYPFVSYFIGQLVTIKEENFLDSCFLFLQLQCAINPMVTLYFVPNYRKFQSHANFLFLKNQHFLDDVLDRLLCSLRRRCRFHPSECPPHRRYCAEDSGIVQKLLNPHHGAMRARIALGHCKYCLDAAADPNQIDNNFRFSWSLQPRLCELLLLLHMILHSRNTSRVELWCIPFTIIVVIIHVNTSIHQTPTYILEGLVNEFFPEFTAMNLAINGHDSLSIPVLIVNGFYLTCLPTVWVLIFVLRRNVLNLLNGHEVQMSQRSKLLQKAFVKSVTVHASLSLLALYPSLAYFIGQFIAIHEVNFLDGCFFFLQLQCAITPLVTIYYVPNYRRAIKRIAGLSSTSTVGQTVSIVQALLSLFAIYPASAYVAAQIVSITEENFLDSCFFSLQLQCAITPLSSRFNGQNAEIVECLRTEVY